MLVAPVLFPEPLLVLLPVLVWGCGLPLLVPPWLAPLLPVVPVPEPVLAWPEPLPVPVLVVLAWPEPVLLPLPALVFVLVPLPVSVVGLLASRLFKPWRGLSLGPPGLRGGWKSGPGPDDFETPTPPLLPLLLLVVVCGGVPP